MAIGRMRGKLQDSCYFEGINKFLTALIALAVILNTNSIWTSVPGVGSSFVNLLYLILIISILGIIVLNFKKYEFNKLPNILFLTVYFSIYLIYVFTTNYVSFSFGAKLLVAFLAFEMYFLKQKETGLPILLKFYVNWIVVIGIISLFFWLFGSFLNIIQPSNFVFSKWASFNGYPIAVPSYLNMYFITQYINGIPRNSAIFTEAPMAALNFLMAFSINTLLDLNKKMSKFKSVILFLCILTTFSVTGYIGLIIIITYKFFSYRFKDKILNQIKVIMVIVLFFISVVLVNKIFTQKIGTESGNIRIDDYIAGYKAWKTHPIMGVGLVSTSVQQYMSMWRSYNLGYSNSLMDLLSHGGIYLFIPYVLAWLKSLIYSVRIKDYNLLIFTIIVLYLFSTTIFTNSFLIILIFVYLGNINLIQLRAESEER